MRPAWHLFLLLSISSACCANTLHLSMHENNSQLNFSLAANPSTGYSWKLIKYDARVLRLDRQKYTRSKSHAIGAAGATEFSFTRLPHPANIHTTQLTLSYARSWDKTSSNLTNVIVDLNDPPE